MDAVDAANKAEIAMIYSVLVKKFGQLYANIWKVGVNLSLRISDLLTLKYADLNLDERSLKLTTAYWIIYEKCNWNIHGKTECNKD
jgi:integrase